MDPISSASESPVIKLPEDLLIQFGQRIAKLAKGRGWSQTEVARRASIRPPRLSRISRGTEVPRVDEFFRLAAVFEVSLDELAYGDTRAKSRVTQIAREIEALGSAEEIAGLSRILYLILLGYQAKGSGRKP
jgi:transcriptional regulator with XRE-family HTH domain